ncbi:MAG: cobyric acid synthase [Solirubrobacterales bacterium]
MPALMIQGTSSWAGKSLLATAVARIFARRGVDVAPFKGVNMSNNARAVEGGEIGVAQYLQALAAGRTPDVRMNPVLIKPEADTRSQVVLLGRADHELSAIGWRERAEHLRPAIADSLASLIADHELVVAEGAGSPAEINLYDIDLANMHVARLADARVLLVADINRGGAFAHLYGTWSLLPPDDRARIGGFVLNRFRGDAALLAPGPRRLEELTGVPVLGVVPWLDHSLPDEDGVTARSRPPSGGPRPAVAIVRYPAASNLDEFKPLERVARLRWAHQPADLDEADLVVLPGSKHVAADLRWLRAARLDYAIAKRVAGGGRVLAICGGLQMVGGPIDDPAGVEGAADGLGFLPLTTTLDPEKQVGPVDARFSTALDAPWSGVAGVSVTGYEIRHGASAGDGSIAAVLPGGLGFASGPILGVYLHGLFENPAFVAATLGVDLTASTEDAIEELATLVEPHLEIEAIARLAGVA